MGSIPPSLEGVKARTEADLDRVRKSLRSDRKWDWILAWSGIIGGILSAGAAGFVAAIGGPTMDVFGGWRPFCGVVSAVGIAAAAANAIHKGRGYPDRVANGESASAALQDLEIRLPDMEGRDARERLGQIIKDNPRVLA